MVSRFQPSQGLFISIKIIFEFILWWICFEFLLVQVHANILRFRLCISYCKVNIYLSNNLHKSTRILIVASVYNHYDPPNTRSNTIVGPVINFVIASQDGT